MLAHLLASTAAGQQVVFYCQGIESMQRHPGRAQQQTSVAAATAGAGQPAFWVSLCAELATLVATADAYFKIACSRQHPAASREYQQQL
jgi:hypothetical protein